MDGRQATRRHYLLGIGTTGVLGLAGCIAEDSGQTGAPEDADDSDDSDDAPEDTSPPDFGGYLTDVSGYDGTVENARGQDEVLVEVGVASDAGDHYAFGPPAVHVDPGTTVVWKWPAETDESPPHNVVAEDGSFDSGEVTDEPGHTFEYTPDADGIYKYYCAPHKGIGMKGALVVGDDYPTESEETPSSQFGGYLDSANNYDGTVADRTGRANVKVGVGAGENGLAFDPAAIHVDEGATVTWEWTSDGGAHTVTAEGGTFDSGEPVGEQGHTFDYTFEESGVYTYYCKPHKGVGMKGVVAVGSEYTPE